MELGVNVCPMPWMEEALELVLELVVNVTTALEQIVLGMPKLNALSQMILMQKPSLFYPMNYAKQPALCCPPKAETTLPSSSTTRSPPIATVNTREQSSVKFSWLNLELVLLILPHVLHKKKHFLGTFVKTKMFCLLKMLNVFS